MPRPGGAQPPQGGSRPAPAEVTITDDAILIRWQDGHESAYPHRYLRLRCQCATCVGEGAQRRTLDPATVREDVAALEFMPVGRYALQFLWSDAHYTGLYPFDVLRAACPCGECPPAQ